MRAMKPALMLLDSAYFAEYLAQPRPFVLVLDLLGHAPTLVIFGMNTM